MKNKYNIGQLIKTVDKTLGASFIGEIERVIQTKDGFEYQATNHESTIDVKEANVIASYSPDAMRKPRTTAKKKVIKQAEIKFENEKTI